ncbi:hypothetical protein BN3087_280010 [Sulfurovum sp. enrichment culture clone C5]|uniref:Uncharacterized protein n=1 Tax=Sulfurovum sp. enrichment culture clone C5 TaxID=497650 RepID=A0A0S4XM07_9BACT|nr:hypothetical protein BN3087_280010 [Sulfurovum sp. enrichment culture clone C5]
MDFNKDLIESFCLEIISNTTQIRNDKNKLLVHKYATKASLILLESLCLAAEVCEESAKYLYKDINWSTDKIVANNFKILRQIKGFVEQLAFYLDYLEHSRVDNVPNGLATPFARIAKHIILDVEIILYQQWDYNYSIRITDIQHGLAKVIVEPFKTYVQESLYEKAIKNMSQPIYPVAFPYLEKNNIFQYSLLGHEIGHLYADRLLKDVDIHTSLNLLLKKHLNDEKIKDNIPEFIDYCAYIWKRLFEELMSDAVGTVLFGPAMVFSISEFALHYDLDLLPSRENNFYPPWRSRLRLSIEVLKRNISDLESMSNGSSLFGNAQIQDRIESIIDIIKKQSDLKAMKSDEILSALFKNVYDHVVSKQEEIYKHFSKNNFNKDDFFKKIELLSDRLTRGIPPNTTNDLDSTKNATLCEILNAAWKERISWESGIFDGDGSFKNESLKKRTKLNDLTNKAIEFSELQASYLEFK